MNKFLKKFFIKFITGECRHLCVRCKHFDECLDETYKSSWAELFAYYKGKKERIKRSKAEGMKLK